MKKILLSGLFACLLCAAWAQGLTVTGKITDAEDDLPLPGVNVTVKGTTTGTVSDENGLYTLKVPSTETTLIFTFIGMASQEVSVAGGKTIDVSMQHDATQLTEIVVVETGYSSERNFVGAAVKLDKEKFETAPMISIDQSLQGQVAGVLVNSGSGQPGADAMVRIRGVSSISGAGTQPLYVIDGVPIVGALSAVNANDIESITVLKDGSTAALYGARGANGVIVISTKKPKPGESSFVYRTQLGLSQQPSPSNFNMMNTDQALEYERRLGAAGAGITGPGWAYSPDNPEYQASTEEEKAAYDAALQKFRNNRRDYADYLFRDGLSSTHEIVARAATDQGRYYTSFNIFDQDGFAKGSNYTRYTGRINMDQHIDKFTMTLMATAARSVSSNSVGDWIGNSPTNPFQILWRAKPYEAVYNEDGSLDYGSHTSLAPRRIANAIERQQNTIFRSKDVRILGGLALRYDITNELSIKNQVGVDFTNIQGMFSANPDSYAGTSIYDYNSGYHTEATLNVGQVINTLGIDFHKRINEIHEVELAGYFEALKYTTNGFGYELFNLDKRLTETGQGAGNIPVATGQTSYEQSGAGAKSQYGIRSYFATSRYTLKDKYTVNANFRMDGTSRILNEDNKEIATWSAGLGWNATNEEFMRSQGILTELKVRASYGEVPNIGSIDTDSYSLPGTFFSVPNFLQSQLATYESSTSFAGSSIAGLVPATPGYGDLKIETVKMFNVGFDLAVKNKVRLVMDFYKNVTVDLFVNQPLGATTGFGDDDLQINAGQMTNKGIEATVLADVYKQGDWTIQANWNHAINVNNIDDLGLVDEYELGTFLIKKGLPYGTHYTYDYVGADPETGKPVYRNKDGSTATAADAEPLAKYGTFLPKHTGGFSFTVDYKRIKLSTFFTYQFDVTRSNNVKNWITRGTAGYSNAVNQSADMLTQQWMQPGDDKFYQSPLYDRGFTSADLGDAKFLRLRELTLSYILPELPFVQRVRVYARGQNIKVWSPWKGLDPEDNNNISLNEYPNPRMYVMGVDVSF